MSSSERLDPMTGPEHDPDASVVWDGSAGHLEGMFDSVSWASREMGFCPQYDERRDRYVRAIVERLRSLAPTVGHEPEEGCIWVIEVYDEKEGSWDATDFYHAKENADEESIDMMEADEDGLRARVVSYARVSPSPEPVKEAELRALDGTLLSEIERMDREIGDADFRALQRRNEWLESEVERLSEPVEEPDALEDVARRLEQRPRDDGFDPDLLLIRGTLCLRPEPEVRQAMEALDRIEARSPSPEERRVEDALVAIERIAERWSKYEARDALHYESNIAENVVHTCAKELQGPLATLRALILHGSRTPDSEGK